MSKVIQLIEVTPEELKQEIIDGIMSLLPAAMTKQQDHGLMTREETAQYLNISLRTLKEWSDKKKLQPYGIGNRVYYKKSEIINGLTAL